MADCTLYPPLLPRSSPETRVVLHRKAYGQIPLDVFDAVAAIADNAMVPRISGLYGCIDLLAGKDGCMRVRLSRLAALTKYGTGNIRKLLKRLEASELLRIDQSGQHLVIHTLRCGQEPDTQRPPGGRLPGAFASASSDLDTWGMFAWLDYLTPDDGSPLHMHISDIGAELNMDGRPTSLIINRLCAVLTENGRPFVDMEGSGKSLRTITVHYDRTGMRVAQSRTAADRAVTRLLRDLAAHGIVPGPGMRALLERSARAGETPDISDAIRLAAAQEEEPWTTIPAPATAPSGVLETVPDDGIATPVRTDSPAVADTMRTVFPDIVNDPGASRINPDPETTSHPHSHLSREVLSHSGSDGLAELPDAVRRSARHLRFTITGEHVDILREWVRIHGADQVSRAIDAAAERARTFGYVERSMESEIELAANASRPATSDRDHGAYERVIRRA